MPMDEPTTRQQLTVLTDVIDALRDELALLEGQLDRDQERLRFSLEGVEVELQVVVTAARAKEGGVTGKVGFAVPALAEAGVELGGKGTTTDSVGQTHTVRLSLKPVRLSEDHAEQRKAGHKDDVLLGGAE